MNIDKISKRCVGKKVVSVLIISAMLTTTMLECGVSAYATDNLTTETYSSIENSPSVTFSQPDKTIFTTETLDVVLGLNNAEGGTYSIDNGPVQKFEGSTTVTLGQGKVGNSDIKLDVTATNGTLTTQYSYTYHKKYVVKQNAPANLLSGFYFTNGLGNGAKRTITIDGDISDDWNSSMIIAQGSANDDPRVYRPDSMYEIPFDMYALYGAYDSQNLYLMWEMTNVQDVVAPNEEYPIQKGTLYETTNVPFFIAIDTGKSDTIGNNGKTVTGETLWNSGITFGDNSFNRLVAVSSTGRTKPLMFGGSDAGLNVSAMSTSDSDIKVSYGKGILSDVVYGLDGAYGMESTVNPRFVSDICSDDGQWCDFNEKGHNSDKMDFHYEMSISLSSLGITEQDIKTNGVGALVVVTSGKSGMDCLPYDLSMSDVADMGDSGNSQENFSLEKSDKDNITAPFARIGNGKPLFSTPLQADFGVNVSSPQISDMPYTISAKGYGGVAPYNYEFYVDTTLVKKNSRTATYEWTPNSGNHYIKCVITDSVGTKKTVSKSFTIYENPVVPLSNTSTISAGTIKLGESVKLQGSATGGTAPYQYNYYYKELGSKDWVLIKDFSSTSSVEFKPEKSTTYSFCIKVKDSKGVIEKVYPTLNVLGGDLKNTSTLSATSIKLGETVKLQGSATGGTAPYKYSYYYKESGSTEWILLKDFSSTATLEFKPNKVTTYSFSIKVKDSTGKIEKAYPTVKVVENKPLANTSTLSATSIKLGETVKLQGSATGGTAPYKYSYYCKESGSTEWVLLKDFSSTATLEFKPDKAKTYSFSIKVKDSTGTIEKAYPTVKVVENKPLENTSTLSATTIKLGESVKLQGSATGGTAPYKYSYYYKKSGSTEWVLLKDFSSTATLEFKPNKVTTYSFSIKVKDSTGTIEKAYPTVKVVENKPLVNTSTLSATSIKLGETVKLQGSATGGTAPYKYSYYCKESGSTEWVLLKDFSSTATLEFKPDKAKTYSFCIKVKDSTGTIEKVYPTVKVS